MVVIDIYFTGTGRGWNLLHDLYTYQRNFGLVLNINKSIRQRIAQTNIILRPPISTFESTIFTAPV